MNKLLLAAAAALVAAYANSEYQKQQLGKELWAKATDQPESSTSQA